MEGIEIKRVNFILIPTKYYEENISRLERRVYTHAEKRASNRRLTNPYSLRLMLSV